METKEAIEFLEECQDEIIDLQEKGHDELLKQVIELLQRGEKYEPIMKKNIKWLKNFIDDIQNKIQEIEISVETKELKPALDNKGRLWSRCKPTGKYTVILKT